MGKIQQDSGFIWCLSGERKYHATPEDKRADPGYRTRTGLNVDNKLRITRSLGYLDASEASEEVTVTPLPDGRYAFEYSGQGPLAQKAFSRERYSLRSPAPVPALNDLIAQVEEFELQLSQERPLYLQTNVDATDVDAILSHLGLLLTEGQENNPGRRIPFSRVLPPVKTPVYTTETPEQRFAGDVFFRDLFIADVYHKEALEKRNPEDEKK